MALSSFLPTDFNVANFDDDSDTEAVMESMKNGLGIFSQNSASDISSSQQSNSSKENIDINGCDSPAEDITDVDTVTSQCDLDSLLCNVGAGQSDNHYDREAFIAMHSSPKATQRVPFASLMNPTTPTKINSLGQCDMSDPLTPTANLKMLISAASPEIRNLDRRKEQAKQNKSDRLTTLREEKDGPGQDDEDGDAIAQPGGSRKEKSLGLLCQKFLARFPEYPGANEKIEICLDEVAKDLNVERRRIYDIVNVLESVELVSRVGKNKYAWHGKTNLKHTLSKLKALGMEEGFAEQMDQVKNIEMKTTRKDGKAAGSHKRGAARNSPHKKKTPTLIFMDETNITCNPSLKAHMRKDKSLGIMSQKFLMMFLTSKNKTCNLDLSAKVIIGDPNIDKTENSKFKTKIRRLYDIANILTSLGLIRKVHVTEVRGRKPAFKYVGPDLDDCAKDIHSCSEDGCHRPSSRHSLLDCVNNPKVSGFTSINTDFQLLNKPKSTSFSKKLFTSHSSFDETIREKLFPSTRPGKSSFTRHSSFEVICEAAEQERRKLYGQHPPSPAFEWPSSFLSKKTESNAEEKECSVTPSEIRPASEAKSSDKEYKYYFVIRNNNSTNVNSQNASSQDSNSTDNTSKPPGVVAVHKIPVSSMDMVTNPNSQQVTSIIKVKNTSEPIIIRKRVVKPKYANSSCEQSQANGQNVKSSDTAGSSETSKSVTSSKCVDAATQMSPIADRTCSGNAAMRMTLPVYVDGYSRNVKEFTNQNYVTILPQESNQNSQKRLLTHDQPIREENKRYKVDSEGRLACVSKFNLDANRQRNISPPVTGCQDAEVEKINRHPTVPSTSASQARPSPLRALHLDPEFSNHSSPSPDSEQIANNLHSYELASPFPSEVSDNNSDSGMESLKDESNSRPPPEVPTHRRKSAKPRKVVKTSEAPVCNTDTGAATVSDNRSSSAMSVPIMRLSNTSSPVMLLSRPSSVSSLMDLDLSSFNLQPVSSFPQLSLSNNSLNYLSNSMGCLETHRNSPRIFTFGSAGVSSLKLHESGDSGAANGHNQSNNTISPTPVHLVPSLICTPNTSVAEPVSMPSAGTNVQRQTAKQINSDVKQENINTFLSPADRMQFAIDQRTPSTSVIRNINPMLSGTTHSPGNVMLSPLCGTQPLGLLPVVNSGTLLPGQNHTTTTVLGNSAFQAVGSNVFSFNTARKLELANLKN